VSIITSIKELLKAIGFWKLALLAVAGIAMLAAMRFFPVLDWIKAFGEWSAQLGFAGAVIYGVVFGIAAILMVPCLPLTIFAGFAFGMFSGLVAVWIGIAIGAAFGFLFARYVARDVISKKLAQNDRFRSIDSAIEKEGWKIVGLAAALPAAVRHHELPLRSDRGEILALHGRDDDRYSAAERRLRLSRRLR
jgi:uncharacterized membrane protein YdjX (TVP38/TMEM64 family)